MGFEFEDKDVKQIAQFTGLRNNVTVESFEPNDLSVALNVDITDALKIQRRKGFAQLQAGNFHSIWGNAELCYVVSGSTLYRYNADGSLTSIRTDLTPGCPMSYEIFAGRVYYSNGVETGVIAADLSHGWGVVPPAYQPEAFVIGGTLPAGNYQYAMTFVRRDGVESGTATAGSIELAAPGGLGFRALPVSDDSDVTARHIYISPVNGDALYRLIVLGTNESAATYIAERIGALPLTTQHLSPPPPSSIVAAYNGILYVATGNRLIPSLPFSPELFDIRSDFTFDDQITIVAPVDDGIYVGTNSDISFLNGTGPDDFKLSVLTQYGAIPGTRSYGAAQDVTPDARGRAAYFATTEGICLGLNGGSLRNLTRDRFMYPATPRGAGVLRKQTGMIQYLVTLQGTGVPASTAF